MCRVPVLEVFEIMQRLLTVEHLDVLGLRRRQLAHRPRKVNEVRLDWGMHRMHSNLARQAVRFASVAGAASGDDVRPFVRSATGQRHEMVACERLARLELDLVSAAVLAAIAVSREQEGVGHLPAESPGHVDEPRQPDDKRTWQRQSLGADHPIGISFDDFRFSVNDQPQRSSERHHGERLERSVQCKTAYDQAPPSLLRRYQYTTVYWKLPIVLVLLG